MQRVYFNSQHDPFDLKPLLEVVLEVKLMQVPHEAFVHYEFTNGAGVWVAFESNLERDGAFGAYAYLLHVEGEGALDYAKQLAVTIARIEGVDIAS